MEPRVLVGQQSLGEVDLQSLDIARQFDIKEGDVRSGSGEQNAFRGREVFALQRLAFAGERVRVARRMKGPGVEHASAEDQLVELPQRRGVEESRAERPLRLALSLRCDTKPIHAAHFASEVGQRNGDEAPQRFATVRFGDPELL